MVIILKLTAKELLAITDTLDNASAHMGEDINIKQDIKTIDKALLRNGYKRQYN